MIFLVHKTSTMRANVPGQVFEPDQMSPKIHEEFTTAVSELIANQRLRELWDMEHALDGKIADWWGYIAYCMKMAHVKMLQKYYWRNACE